MNGLQRTQIETAFTLLGERLQSDKLGPFRLVVCGGASLISMSLISRATRDVDIVALIDEKNNLISPEPIPPDLANMAKVVADDLDLDENWLNTGPKDIFKFGLPDGFLQRLTMKEYGTSLVIYFSGRLDQVYFKVYAAADQGPGKHLSDLLNLEPTDMELEEAANWAMTHDISETFRSTLRDMFIKIGHENAARRL